MYFPYLRGKQNELKALRETATKLKADKVFPIIEPVKLSVNALALTVKDLNEQLIEPIIVINPEHGDYANLPSAQLSNTLIGPAIRYTPCIRIKNNNLESALDLVDEYLSDDLEFALYIQEDITQAADVEELLLQAKFNIFLEPSSYPPSFINNAPRSVFLRDAFPVKARNADYPSTPVYYSNSHLAYNNGEYVNQIGFGDFLNMPEKWVEGGGPAYVIAIHLTYIDTNMYVRHFLSFTDSDEQTKPQGKFKEALALLIDFSKNNQCVNKTTQGYLGYLDLHNRGHYPGLGISKKFSMMHHIETISEFL